MRIATDARLLERRITGIGKYFEGVFRNILKIDKKNEYFLFSSGKIGKYSEKGFRIIPTGRNHFLPQKISSPLWLQTTLPLLLKKYKIDLFYSPHFVLPLIKTVPKCIVTIHDLAHKISKDFKDPVYQKYLWFLLRYSLRNSEAIITISQNSKRDILKYYGKSISADKIKIVYPAVDERFKPMFLRNYENLTKVRKKYFLPEEFILYVGRIENRKNIQGIIKVADRLNKLNSLNNLNIVLVGETGYAGSKDLMEEIKKRNNIHHIEYIEDKDIPYVYNLAKIFLFLSFYEGFGLPVLEAMQSGLPVLTSNTSSLPEVVSNGGIMHNPVDYEGFTKDIVRLLEDKKFYQEMSCRAISQAKKFSWRESTNKLVKVFEEIGSN